MPTPLLIALLAPLSLFDFDDALHAGLARAGDVDGDKVEDFIAMGAPTGPLILVSGRTGERIRVLEAATPEWTFGRSLACAGDLNADGVPDQLVGGFGAVRIYSGRDGSVLRELRPATANLGFGFHVAGEGELDGDGVPDFLVVTDETKLFHEEGRRRISGMSPRIEQPGRVDLYSGRTFEPISYALPLEHEPPLHVTSIVPWCNAMEWAVEHEVPAVPFDVRANELVLGRAAAFLPDADADGLSEIAVVCHRPEPCLNTVASVFVDIRSGGTGARLRAFGTEYLAANGEGWLVGSAGDLDGDGVADPFLAVLNQDLVVFAAKSGKPLLHDDACGFALNGEYTSVAALGDLDGDGRGEIAYAGNEVGFDTDSGEWCVLDSKGAVLKRESFPGLASGFEISAAGDLDGDKVPDLVVLEHTQRSLRGISGKGFVDLWTFWFDAPPATSPR